MVNARDLARLVRLPLAITALGDPVAGLVLAGGRAPLPGAGVALAAAFLYLGGMALNDLFDVELDRVHHPERVLPSGRLRPTHALAVGGGGLVAGVTLASLVRLETGVVALALAAAIVLYDGGVKRVAWVGCGTMGLCRALSLVMGATAGAGFTLPWWCWGAAAVHATYGAAVTGVSRLEEAAGPVPARRLRLRLLPALAALVAVPVIFASRALAAAGPVVVLGYRLTQEVRRGRHRLARAAVMRQVEIGVRGILLLDAAYLWGAGAWGLGGVLISTYGLSFAGRILTRS